MNASDLLRLRAAMLLMLAVAAGCGDGGGVTPVPAVPSDTLWVADNGNSRVLEFEPPFSNGMNASTVIGKPNFTNLSCTVTQSTTSFQGGPAVVP